MERQVRAGRRVFWRTWLIGLLLFVLNSIYLINAAIPDVYPKIKEVLAHLGSFWFDALPKSSLRVMRNRESYAILLQRTMLAIFCIGEGSRAFMNYACERYEQLTGHTTSLNDDTAVASNAP
ncbi:hypothetical protein [Pseudomonas endophytica]|nr:hypothetical protein [Pseudomonas endophytica]